ncbi:MAG: fused MFS/spermidine synthase [Pseudomonadota bacterium]
MKTPVNRLKDFQDQFIASATKHKPDMPFIYDEKTTLSMHFDTHSIQSVMLKTDPEYLILDYTRTMMGFLFFTPAPKTIAMIGLGGGSLAKYCTKYLPNAHFTAIEINANVIALREQFNIPADSEKFSILHTDGHDYVTNKVNKVDVLIIDAFTDAGHPPKLCSAGFYDNCYAKLNEGGVMVANLLGSDIKFGTYASRIRDSFEDKVVVVDVEDEGNKIAFAYKGSSFPPSKEVLVERIGTWGPKHPIPLHNTAQKIMHRLHKHTSHTEWEQLSRVGM